MQSEAGRAVINSRKLTVVGSWRSGLDLVTPSFQQIRDSFNMIALDFDSILLDSSTGAAVVLQQGQ